MAERDQDIMIPSKINTLEESLKQFGMLRLLELLDMSLELVRWNKETKEKHLELLKSVDKDLLKLSQIYHPDKAIGGKKSDEEVTNAQNLQIALNATRTVLKVLGGVFLKDIDFHYMYEFFAKSDINTLVNVKEIDKETDNVLCKISRLSEIKRLNIVGEIRKFLQESRECLRNFLEGSDLEFARDRESALIHLRRCIEGYKKLAAECASMAEGCRVMQKISEQSLAEHKMLQDLERVAERSLKGSFEILPAGEFGSHDPAKPVKYEDVVPKEHMEYLVSPFTFYVNVLLMCSVMVAEKTLWRRTVSGIRKFLEHWFGINTEKSVNFPGEPLLLKAYHLASYFDNRNHYKQQVQTILRERGHDTSESYVIRDIFKETVAEIGQLLAEKFDLSSYKEGRRNRDLLNDQLSKSTAEFNEAVRNAQEIIKLYEQESNELRKKYSKLSKNGEKNEQECQKNTSKHENKSEIADEMIFNRNNIPENRMLSQSKTHENEIRNLTKIYRNCGEYGDEETNSSCSNIILDECEEVFPDS